MQAVSHNGFVYATLRPSPPPPPGEGGDQRAGTETTIMCVSSYMEILLPVSNYF